MMVSALMSLYAVEEFPSSKLSGYEAPGVEKIDQAQGAATGQIPQAAHSNGVQEHQGV